MFLVVLVVLIVWLVNLQLIIVVLTFYREQYEESKRTYIQQETVVKVQAGPELEAGMDMFDAIDVEAVKGEKDRLAMDLANLQSKYDQLQKNYDNVKDDNNRFVLYINNRIKVLNKKYGTR